MPTESQRFVGPRPFEREESQFFFGRGPEAEELASLIVAHSEVVLYSQSGAGKSSLLNAGLTPLLEREGFEVLPTARVRGELPDEAGKIGNVYVFNVLARLHAAGSAAEPPGDLTLAAYLGSRRPLPDQDGEPRPRVLLIDQFEELFTFYTERAADRRGFFEQLRDALNADRFLRIVFAMREEYLAELAPFASLMPERLRTRVRLERLRAPAALEAVTGPLKGSHLSFAPGAAEWLVTELLQVNVGGRSQPVRGEHIEPVQLQVVCDWLCRRLPKGVTVIDDRHLRTFGDVNEALSTFYEECLRETKRSAHISIGALRKWFRDVLITPEGTRDAVRMGHGDTGGLPNRAVSKLEELHIVRGEERAGRGRWYELTHDRFIAPIRASNEKAGRYRSRLRRVATAAAVLTLVVICLILNEGRRAANERARRAEQSLAALAGGNRLAETGRHRDAIPQFDEAIKLDPRNSEAHVKAAESHAALGDGAKAIAHYQQAQEIKPSASVGVDLGGIYLYFFRDFDKARAEFEKAIALDPASAKPHTALGDLETERVKASGGTDYRHAKPHYETAIRKDAKSPGGYLGLGYLHLYEGDAGAAVASFQPATELAGEGLARSHSAFGEALFWKGDLDQALAECALGAGLASTESPVNRRMVEQFSRGRMADIYYLRRRYDLVELELGRALKLATELGYHSEIADTCSSLGFAALRQRKIQEAGKWFHQALTENPKASNALFGAGIFFANLGHPVEARDCWNRALESCHGTDPLQRMQRVVFNVALGSPGTAEAMQTILKSESPPPGMLMSVSDDTDLLALYGISLAESKKVCDLVEKAIREAAEKDRKTPNAPQKKD